MATTQQKSGTALLGLIKTLRIKQWTKNGFVFIPLLFDVKLFDVEKLLAATAGFFLFCFFSSIVYLVNDIVDLEADREHPAKRNRPLPSGQTPILMAIIAAGLLAGISIPLAFLLDTNFALIGLLYLVLQAFYSFKFKNIVLIDVMTIAAGFLLRVASGTILISAERFSPWLYIFTAMLALFLGFSKRRGELILLQEKASHHRAILEDYTVGLLDEIIMIVTGMTVVTYTLYTFSAEGLPDNHAMMLTTPFVLYGIFRYLYLIHVRGEVKPPDEVLLSDRPIQFTVVLWGIAVILILYIFR